MDANGKNNVKHGTVAVLDGKVVVTIRTGWQCGNHYSRRACSDFCQRGIN